MRQLTGLLNVKHRAAGVLSPYLDEAWEVHKVLQMHNVGVDDVRIKPGIYVVTFFLLSLSLSSYLVASLVFHSRSCSHSMNLSLSLYSVFSLSSPARHVVHKCGLFFYLYFVIPSYPTIFIALTIWSTCVCMCVCVYVHQRVYIGQATYCVWRRRRCTRGVVTSTLYSYSATENEWDWSETERK